MSSKGKANKSAAKSVQRSRARRNRAEALVLPTEPNQYGTTALIKSDFSALVSKHLAPYNTIGNQNFFWRASTDAADLIQASTGDLNAAMNFTLSSVYGSSDFSAVFDQYRLRAVSFTMSPRPGPPFTGNGNIEPRLWTAIDYDDSNNVIRSAIEQYDTCVVSPPTTGVVRTFIPRCALAAYSGSFTSYANVQDTWFDIASPNVQHYGIKVVIESGISTQIQLRAYAVSYVTYWEFRATR